MIELGLDLLAAGEVARQAGLGACDRVHRILAETSQLGELRSVYRRGLADGADLVVPVAQAAPEVSDIAAGGGAGAGASGSTAGGMTA